MKNVIQLDSDGYFLGVTVADESPLEPGVFLYPANTIDAEFPVLAEGERAKWENEWIIESPTPQPPEPIPDPEPELTYAEKRALEYPPIGDQLDALFHAGVFPPEMAAQLQAVKDKYPKETQ